MEEQRELRNKLIKHIIYNLIGFATIFIIFGIFVFLLVRNITYNNVNKYLYESQQQLLNMDSEKINVMFDSKVYKDGYRDDWIQNTIRSYQDEILTQRIGNPNVIVVLRDMDGNIVNESELIRLNEYIEDLDFNSKNLDKIYELTVGNSYSYRGLNFIFDGNDLLEDRYVQLLINVDSEKNLVNSYFQIISSAVVVGIVFSIFASYILSEKTLKPLQENLIRQTEFVQNVSHELRTPLTIIQAKQELLLQEPDSKIVDKSEDIILTLNETRRLTKLIKDLMLLSRADSNKNSIQKENVNIDDYIKELVAPYKELAEMQEKELKLDLNYKVDIDIDTNKIYQLMIILLDNAIKYTEEKDTIEIKTYAKDNKCVIEVKDTGIGVSDEGLKRIFERFYREDRARSRETGGTGLGLSIATYIVSAHGGTIKATHNKPKGTLFTIRLPK
jgi:two-component system sensor histidine kinase CiaH